MKVNPVCEVNCFNQSQINHVQNEFKKMDLSRISQFMKAIADTNRTKIVYALTIERELCVCDLAIIINATIANTSRHLCLLHDLGVVKRRKEGKLVFYALDDAHVYDILKIAMIHTEEGERNETRDISHR